MNSKSISIFDLPLIASSISGLPGGKFPIPILYSDFPLAPPYPSIA